MENVREAPPMMSSASVHIERVKNGYIVSVHNYRNDRYVTNEMGEVLELVAAVFGLDESVTISPVKSLHTSEGNQ